MFEAASRQLRAQTLQLPGARTDAKARALDPSPLKSAEYLDFSTDRTKMIMTLQKQPSLGMSITPDERWLLYSQMTRPAVI